MEVLLDTWERITEEREEGDRFAAVVVLKVDGTLREESSLVVFDFVEDEFATILRDHASDNRAIGYIKEFCRPRVGMRRVHATWAKEPDSCTTCGRGVSRAGTMYESFAY